MKFPDHPFDKLQQLIELLRLKFYNRLTWIIVVGGLAIMSSPLWVKVVESLLENSLELQIVVMSLPPAQSILICKHIGDCEYELEEQEIVEVEQLDTRLADGELNYRIIFTPEGKEKLESSYKPEFWPAE